MSTRRTPFNASARSLTVAALQLPLGHADEAERMFATIETRFNPSAGIVELIAEAREGGCNHWQAVSSGALTLGRGIDQNVNQGASNQDYTVLRDAFAAHPRLGTPLIAYAVKANSNVEVLRVLGDLGAGADTVSEGEIRRALAAGVAPARIVFSGVGKTRTEIAFALQTGVAEINVESEPEMEAIAAVAQELGLRAPIAFRVNPDVSAGGHAKIATG